MRIKHSKYKNTGLLYEFLISQIAADTITGVKSPAVRLLRKYFGKDTELSKEYKVYEFILKNKGSSPQKANSILTAALDITCRLNEEEIKAAKYNLVSDIKKYYSIDQVFSRKVVEYKALAGFYCLIEANKAVGKAEPSQIVENRETVLQYLIGASSVDNDLNRSIFEEYSKYDKDLKLLTYKILLEKFNSKYKNLIPEQKEVLRQLISSVGSEVNLREFANLKLREIKSRIGKILEEVKDPILKIKILEVQKTIQEVPKGRKIKEDTLYLLMKYFELLTELEGR